MNEKGCSEIWDIRSYNVLQSFGGENKNFNTTAKKEMKKVITRMNL